MDINTTKGYARYTDEEKNRILDRAYGKLYPEAEGLQQEPDSLHTEPAKNGMPPLVLKPIEYLRMQLIKGEISKEDYLQMMSLLNWATMESLRPTTPRKEVYRFWKKEDFTDAVSRL